MKKIYYLILFIIFVFLLIFGCKRELVESVLKPKGTTFPHQNYTDYTNVRVNVNPEVAPNNMVFGGFSKRFQFKGQWFVLADSMFRYDTSSKRLTKTASNLVLRIDDERTITVYGKNLPYINNRYPRINKDDHDDYMNNAWYNLTKSDLVIENDRIYNEDYWLNYYEYKVNYSERRVDGGELAKLHKDFKTVDCKWPDSLGLFQSGRGITYTTDLLNWTTETNYRISSIPIHFYEPTFDNSRNGTPPINNFNGRNGVKGERIVYFNGYLYVLGGFTMGRDKIEVNFKKDITYNLTNPKYYRIKKGVDTRNPNNWEVIDIPHQLRRAWVGVALGDGKLYINDGYEAKLTTIPSKMEGKFEYPHSYVGNVWSTSDGVNWSTDSLNNWNNARLVSSKGDMNIGPEVQPIYNKKNTIPTPQERISAKIGGKYYYIRERDSWEMVPWDNIKKSVNSGNMNYTLTEEDIKNINLYQLIVSDKAPSIASKSDEHSVSVISPNFTSLIWTSGSYYLFNINDKLVRLVDYGDGRISEAPKYDAEEQLKESKLWYERGNNGGYTNGIYEEYTAKDCYHKGMIYKAWYDIYTYYNTNAQYYMPDKAVTHYSIDFKDRF